MKALLILQKTLPIGHSIRMMCDYMRGTRTVVDAYQGASDWVTHGTLLAEEKCCRTKLSYIILDFSTKKNVFLYIYFFLFFCT